MGFGLVDTSTTLAVGVMEMVPSQNAATLPPHHTAARFNRVQAFGVMIGLHTDRCSNFVLSLTMGQSITRLNLSIRPQVFTPKMLIAIGIKLNSKE